MQTDLRLILLVIGLLVVAAIFLDGVKRRKNNGSNEAIVKHHQRRFGAPPKTEDFDPLLEELESVEEPLAVEALETAELAEAEQLEAIEPAVQAPQLENLDGTIIAMNIIAKSPTGFSGKALVSAMVSNKFKYGAKKMYHCYLNDNPMENTLYSLASMIEPGTFDVQTIAQKSYPGVMLFMVVKKVADPVGAFEDMLKAAYDMAVILNAQVCDIQDNPLSQEKIEQFRNAVQNRAVA